MASGTPTIAESSSSQTLWATASKEWVILPKPKPGRKPKNESASQTSEGDTTCRRTQNRAAQRAFRERKQSQLVELQARIKSYEQGETDRSVALQKVAKRLKDENQQLRHENDILKARVEELEARVDTDLQVMPNQTAIDKKRNRGPSPFQTHLPHVFKRQRDDTMVDYPRLFSADTTLSFSSSPGCTTDSIDSVDQFSPPPYVPRREVCSNGFSTTGNVVSKPKDDGPDILPSFLTCSFCEAGTLCVCREIACAAPMEQSAATKFNTRIEDDDLITSASTNVRDFPDALSNRRNESTILDKSPAYEPALPLRRRNKRITPNSIFPVHVAPPEEISPQATCSGDPNNCIACANDTFGQAFCAAIGGSSQNCDCSTQMISGCCGSSSCSDCPSAVSSLEPDIAPEQMEMMPTNDAWKKLKAHPNVQFADLTLLAEVVTRRSGCSGPQLVVSSQSQTNYRTDGNITGTPRAGDSPPRLVPHEVLLECGRKRMRHVRTDGVRDALRLLDAKFS